MVRKLAIRVNIGPMAILARRPRSRALLLALALLVPLLGSPSRDAAASAATTDPCGAAVPGHRTWTCVFADNFRGDALDPTKWSVMTTSAMGGYSQECRVNDPHNIRVANGRLFLTARRLSVPFLCRSGLLFYPTLNTAGAITTSWRFSTTYGRVEIRAALPRYRGPGFHSAMWMYPQYLTYGAWPKSGEIDVSEYRTSRPDYPFSAIHRIQGLRDQVISGKTCLVHRPHRFHKYVMVWTRSAIRFTYDGRRCLVVRFDPERPTSIRPFDKPFFLVLGQSVGRNWNSPTPRTPNSATLAVDYVRVWH